MYIYTHTCIYTAMYIYIYIYKRCEHTINTRTHTPPRALPLSPSLSPTNTHTQMQFDVELSRTSAFAIRNMDHFVNLVDILERLIKQRATPEAMMPSLQVISERPATHLQHTCNTAQRPATQHNDLQHNTKISVKRDLHNPLLIHYI